VTRQQTKSMEEKSKLVYRIIFGAVIIAGVIFLSFKFLLKGPPFIKIMAIGLIAAVVYLVINYIKKNTIKDD
jgi:hypothetical protein